MPNVNAEKIMTPEGRGSFVHLFEREKNQEGGDGLFSTLLLFPKLSQSWMADLPWLWENIASVLNQKFPGGAGMPPVFAAYGVSKPWPVSDGDAPNGMGNTQEAHRGHWCVRVASGNFNAAVNLVKPDPANPQKCVPVPPQECFSGCYFVAQANAYYNDNRSIVSLSLENMLLTRTGESLGGGGTDAATAFGLEPAVQTAAAAFQPGAQVPAAAPVPAGLAPDGSLAPPVGAAPVGAVPVPNFMS